MNLFIYSRYLVQCNQARAEDNALPDWSYHTLFKPLLFRLTARRGRDLTLALMGGLARTPFGPPLIDLLGHMNPPAELSTHAGGINVSSPVGLGPALDPNGRAALAFARFGFGFLEVPVATEGVADGDVQRHDDIEAISTKAGFGGDVDVIRHNLGTRRPTQPIGFRLAPMSADLASERLQVIEKLRDIADFFTIDMRGVDDWPIDDWRAYLASIQSAAEGRAALWVAVPPGADLARLSPFVDAAVEMGAAAIVVGGGVEESEPLPNPPLAKGRESGRLMIGAPERLSTLTTIAEAHRRWGERVSIVAGGGIVEPGDAVRAMAAGASLVQVDAGMVFSGPGVVKRINEAIIGSRPVADQPSPRSWFWLYALGLSMVFGGVLASIIAATTVVLPYDVAFLGMGQAGIRHVNPRLLMFMTHDRITVGGTMLSIGVLYAMLAAFGVRHGARWAWTVITRSAAIGFASFFLFLGFGYFDPLHALVSAILFVFFLIALVDRPRGVGRIVPDLVNDAAWRRSLVGQFLFVMTGIGLIVAGITISGVGITRVFVPTDLMFLQTTREAVLSANPRLLPLIAHDRAGFGGALWSDGIAVLLTSLWGFRRSASWIWWMILLAGLPGFIAALGVHLAIGYLCFEHLFPVYLSITLFTIGLSLSRGYLCADSRPAATTSVDTLSGLTR